MALPSTGPLSASQIRAEFGGPLPFSLTNYYRKAIQTAINSYVFTTPQNVDALMASENGLFPSTFEDGYKYFTSDYGPLFPRDPMAYTSSLGQSQIVQVDGQNVSQTQGALWGQNALVRSWGCATYFKIRSGETYRFRVRMRALTNPTNTEGHPASHIMGLYLLGAEGFGVAGHALASYPIDAGLGWVIRDVTMSASQIWNLYPNAVWGRLYHHENYCEYTDAVGNFRQVPADCVVQTSMLEVSVVSGQPLNGDSGILTAYDLSAGNDRVLTKVGSTMVVAGGRTSAELGGPRQNTNPFTREIQRLGNFTVVDSPSTTSIPLSGPIKFSDFLGTAQETEPQWTTPTFLGEINPGVPFSFTFDATSASAITYSMISILPGWCTWNPATHTVSGTWPAPLNAPSQEADFIVGASNDYLTTSRQFIYRVVNREAVWTTPSGTLGNLNTGQSFSYQLQASDPEGSNVSYIVHSGTLPPGIGISAAGLISGTPTTAGTYVFEVRLEDNVPRTSATARQFNIVVAEAPPAQPEWFTPSAIVLTANNSAQQNFYYYVKNPNGDTTIEQTPGYSLPTNSTLLHEWPSGTSSNLRGVTIRGNIIPPGTYNIYLDAVNANGRVTRVFTIQIASE